VNAGLDADGVEFGCRIAVMVVCVAERIDHDEFAPKAKGSALAQCPDLPSDRLGMLDFYAFADLNPWPEDVPSTARYLGSIDIYEFKGCLEILLLCLGENVSPSYFADWIISADEVNRITEFFERSGAVSGDESAGARRLFAILKCAVGSQVLAVCD
jgi:hypothetical protein